MVTFIKIIAVLQIRLALNISDAKWILIFAKGSYLPNLAVKPLLFSIYLTHFIPRDYLEIATTLYKQPRAVYYSK